MSTVVSKALEEHSTLKDDNNILNKTDNKSVDMATISVYSDVFHRTAKVGGSSSLAENSQNRKEMKKLLASENGKKVSNAKQANTLQAAPQSQVAAAGMELLVQQNGDGSKQTKSKQVKNSDTSNDEADDLRKAYVAQLATEISFLTDVSPHGSVLSVCSEVSEESVNSVEDGTVVEVDVGDVVTASRTSLSSRKSHTQHKQTSKETDICEASSQAASLMSVRPDESQNFTVSSNGVDVSTSKTSLRTSKPCTKNQVDRLETCSTVPLVASEVSATSDKSQNFRASCTDADVTASGTSVKASRSQAGASEISGQVMSLKTDKEWHVNGDGTKAASLALPHCGNVASSQSVAQGANAIASQHSDDMDVNNSTLGCRLSVKSVDSESSSNSSSVIISKPPKPVAVNKAVEVARPSAECKTSKTTGDSFPFLLHFCSRVSLFVLKGDIL